MSTTADVKDCLEGATAFLAKRMRHRRGDLAVRCTGVSSDALALYGVEEGPRPYTPGTPESPDAHSWRGEECGHDYPHDDGDLLACELTYLMAPKWAQARMLAVLEEFERWVWHGVNRHGDKVTSGTRDLTNTSVGSPP
jgi:hypothetical protein